MPFGDNDDAIYDALVKQQTAPIPSRPKPQPAGHLNELTGFLKEKNLPIGSTTGGSHNRGSKHYVGDAVDIKNSGRFSNDQVNALSAEASQRGFKLRDERVRPPNQAVWGGPHLHLEYSGIQAQQDPYDALVRQQTQKVAPKPAPTVDPYDELVQKQLAPKPDLSKATNDLERVNWQAQNPTVTPPVTKPIPQRRADQLTPSIAQQLSPPKGKNVNKAVLAPASPERTRATLGLPVISAGKQLGETTEATAGIRERNRESLVKQGFQKLQNQEAQLNQLNPDLPSRSDEELQQQAEAETDKQVEATQWHEANKSLIDERATQIRKSIQKQGGVDKWIIETAAQAKAGLGAQVAGAGKVVAPIARALGAPNVEGWQDARRIEVEAMKQAALEEGADRNAVSKWAQGVGAGLISSAPAVGAMALGVPAPLAFAGSGALEAAGSGGDTSDVAKAAAKGGAVGAAFGIPGVGTGLKGAVTKGFGVGAGTTGIELATGAPLSEALKAGGTNALLAGGGSLLHGTTPERSETISAQMKALREGTKDAVLITPGTPRPPTPPGFKTVNTSEGVFIFDPKVVTEKQIRSAVNNGTHGEILGNVAPKPAEGEPTTTVVARTPEGTEVQAAAVPSENAAEQAQKLAETHPTAEIEQGGNELAQQVIADRIAQLRKPSDVANLTEAEQQAIRDQHVEQLAEERRQAERRIIEGTAPSLPRSTTPAPESVLSQSQNSTGSGIHRAVQNVLSNPEWTKAVLTELGEGVKALDNFDNPSVATFRAANGDLVTIKNAYGQSEAPTLGTAREGIIIKRTSGTEQTPERRTADRRTAIQEAEQLPPLPDKETALANIARAGQDPEALAAALRDARDLFIPESEILQAMGQKGAEVSAPVETPTAPSETSVGAVSETAPPPEGPTVAETPVQAGEVKPSTTAANRESVTARRAERGEEPLPLPERKSDKQLEADAKAANAADPTAPIRIVDQVLNGDKGELSDTETIQLDLHRQELNNKYDDVNQRLAKATDPAEVKRLSEESDSYERQMRAAEEASDAAGTEQGRAFRARRLQVAQDFRLLTMISKATKARNRPLTAEERATVESQSERIAELEQKMVESNSRAEQAEAELALERVKKEAARETRKAGRQAKKATLDEEFTNLVSQFRNTQKPPTPRMGSQAGAALLDAQAVALIGKMVRNRVKANLGIKAEQLIDDIHAAIGDISGLSKREIRDVVGRYGRPKETRSELQRKLDAMKSEIYKMSSEEDIAAGKRTAKSQGPRKSEINKFPKEGPPNMPRVNENVRKGLQRRIDEYERRIREGDFSKRDPKEPSVYDSQTLRLQKQLEQTKQDFAKANYKATRGRFGVISDELMRAANVPKTLKSMGDVSAMFRQGGYYALTHPVAGLARPTRAMIRSFKEAGWRNVENIIKNDSAFEELKRAGVEFTGVDKADPHLSKHEEGFLGGETIDVLGKGKYNPLRALKGVKDFSERTFVSFLDSQRLEMGKTMMDGLTDPGIIARTMGAKPAARNSAQYKAEMKAFAELINAGTGRGSLGKYNNAAPFLNIFMFSPRLVASRVRLLNNMVNPVTWARTPPAARAQMLKDNVKFLGATVALIGLAKAAGGTVGTDPDKGDFLKIRFGKTTYDTLTGLQQPMRFMINLANAANARRKDDKSFQGKSIKSLIDPFEPGSFTRSKTSPLVGSAITMATGKDFLGQPASKSKEARELVTPLPAKDVVEAMQAEGLLKGFLKASPTFTGVGVQTYDPNSPQAEKKEKKSLVETLLDERRKGGSTDLDALKAQGKITEADKKYIEKNAKVSQRQQTFENLYPDKALERYERYQQLNDTAALEEFRNSMAKKSYSLLHSDALTDAQKEAFRVRIEKLGITPQGPSKGGGFRDAFRSRGLGASPF